MGRHFITQPQAGHLYRFINRGLIKPSKKVSVNPCPHKWLLRQRGQIEGFCQGNFSPRRFTSLRFTSTNSIIELLWLGLLCPTCFGQLGSAKIQLPFFHKKTASGQRSFNSIILTDLSNHSENAGGVLLIINRKLTPRNRRGIHRPPVGTACYRNDQAHSMRSGLHHGLKGQWQGFWSSTEWSVCIPAAADGTIGHQ